jgi:hypothetical protein
MARELWRISTEHWHHKHTGRVGHDDGRFRLQQRDDTGHRNHQMFFGHLRTEGHDELKSVCLQNWERVYALALRFDLVLKCKSRGAGKGGMTVPVLGYQEEYGPDRNPLRVQAG